MDEGVFEALLLFEISCDHFWKQTCTRRKITAYHNKGGRKITAYHNKGALTRTKHSRFDLNSVLVKTHASLMHPPSVPRPSRRDGGDLARPRGHDVYSLHTLPMHMGHGDTPGEVRTHIISAHAPGAREISARYGERPRARAGGIPGYHLVRRRGKTVQRGSQRGACVDPWLPPPAAPCCRTGGR